MKTIRVIGSMRHLLILLLWGIFQTILPAQNPEDTTIRPVENPDSVHIEDMMINGEIVKVIIEDGDTLLLSTFDEIKVSSKRFFDSDAEYRRYLIYRKYAQDVYPFAVEAIQTYQTVSEATEGLSTWKKKKYVRRVQEQLFKKYEDIFKNLTKTQGRIMIHMIEKELDITMYDLIRDTRGWLTANYWHMLSGFFDYNLKGGYQIGEDPIMYMVLDDLDLRFNE